MPKSRKRRRSNKVVQQGRATLEGTIDSPSFGSAVLIWFGAAGAALTLFGALQSLLDLADWARFIIINWTRLNERIWSPFLALFDTPHPRELSIMLTFFISLTFIAFGAAFFEMRDSRTSNVRGRQILNEEYAVKYIRGAAVASLSMLLFRAAIEVIVFCERTPIISSEHVWLLFGAGFLAAGGLTFVALNRGLQELCHALLLAIFVSGFYFALAFQSAQSALDSNQAAIYRAIVLDSSSITLIANAASILALAHPRFLNYRFTLVFLGLGTLIALNYLSQQGLSLKPTIV